MPLIGRCSAMMLTEVIKLCMFQITGLFMVHFNDFRRSWEKSSGVCDITAGLQIVPWSSVYMNRHSILRCQGKRTIWCKRGTSQTLDFLLLSTKRAGSMRADYIIIHMNQIIQPTKCNSFTCFLLDINVWLNMFRASPRPSSGAYNCTRSPWFCRWRAAAGALLVVFCQTTTNTLNFK